MINGVRATSLRGGFALQSHRTGGSLGRLPTVFALSQKTRRLFTFFNRRPRFAQDDESEEFSLEDWTRHQAEIIAQLFPAIESKVRNVKLQRAIEYAKRHITEVPSTYSPGTHVMALDHNRSTKNEPVYVGPYVVECRMTDHSILLRDPTTNAIVPSTVATHHLKPVQPPLNYPIQPRIMSSLTLAIRKHR